MERLVKEHDILLMLLPGLGFYQVGGNEDATLVLLELLESGESLLLLETGADEARRKASMCQKVTHALSSE